MDSNLFWCIVGIAGGAVFSFIISFIFYLIGKTRKYILYTHKTFCLVSDTVEDIDFLDVKYNNRRIYSLYLSTVEIRNAGNSIIEKNDFPESDPLSVHSSEFAISNSDLENRTYIDGNNNVNWSFKLPADHNLSELIIDFDYIPKRGKICFHVLHTADEIYIRGSLKDGILRADLFTRKEKILLTIGIFAAFIMGIFWDTLFNFL